MSSVTLMEPKSKRFSIFLTAMKNRKTEKVSGPSPVARVAVRLDF
jgi:hypothetical protein